MALRVLMAEDRDADLLESLIRALRNVRGAGGIQVTMMPGAGLTVTQRQRPHHPTQVALGRFRITTNSWDWFQGRLVDPAGSPYGDTVYIAKPFHMQRTPWDGQTVGNYTYTYSSNAVRVSERSGDEEEQRLTPDIVINHTEVLALAGIEGGTGIDDPDGHAIIWQAFDMPHVWALDVETI